jgi:hypothetical protein
MALAEPFEFVSGELLERGVGGELPRNQIQFDLATPDSPAIRSSPGDPESRSNPRGPTDARARR